MNRGSPRMSAQINSQTQNNKKFNLCLIVSRHQLLPAQQKDVESICNKVDMVAELPLDQQKLKGAIQQYDAVVGVFPVNLQVEILNNKKALVVFAMRSLGVTDNEEEANKIASRYPDRTAVLMPSKGNEKFRITLYEGLKLVKEIRIIDEWLIQHSS